MLPLKLLKKLHDTVDPVKRARYGRIVSLLSCFAAGVFMATALLDLFPEVDEILEKAMTENFHTSFPVAEFSVAFGFFLVLILEQIVLDCKERAMEYSSVVMGDVLSPEDIDQLRRTRRQGSIEGLRDQPQLPEAGHVHDTEAEAHSSFRSVLLLVALSLHSLFEGVAIGLQPSVKSVLQIFAAVGLHKVIIAFSLGLNLVQSELKIGAIIRSNLLFCLTSPLGMGLAMGLEEFGHSVDSSVVNGVLQGLACGTFVYITFFEVLPHELNQGGDRLLKLLAVLVGFSVVCGVLFLEPNKESPPSCSSP
ncbi:zinc transporter ZIP1 isoform X2 [Anabrus simplex]